MVVTKRIGHYLNRWTLMVILFPMSILKSHAQDEGAIEKIRINPGGAMGGMVSQYIDQVEFTTFDSNQESAFGNIDQLEITDQYYIILDNDTQSILIFSKQGKLHAKIDGKKINPQQPIFFSFVFDRHTELIKINFLSGEFTFDLQGKQISYAKKDPAHYLGTEATLGSNFSAYYFYNPQMPSVKKNALAHELTVVTGGNILKKYLPYTINVNYNDSRGSQSHMDFWPNAAGPDSILYYTREYDYNIYKLTPHTFQAAYQFLLPVQLNLPANFRTDSTYNSKREQFIKQNRHAIYKIGNFYTFGENITFRAINYDYLSYSYIYNSRSKELICINKIISDAKSYFLPITDEEVGGADFINRGIIHFDGEKHYTSYSSLILFNQMAANKSKNPKYPPALLKYFSNKKNIKGNPVLVHLKFKTQL